jgi:hypothetical protein
LGDGFQLTSTGGKLFLEELDLPLKVLSYVLPDQKLWSSIAVVSKGSEGFDFFLELPNTLDVVVQTGVFLQVDFPHVHQFETYL